MQAKSATSANGYKSRPPIIALLGHVDHGKTSLLDRIRKTNLASREAGGITQSIGAWQVKTPNGKAITFIDTPGHEAFKSMRQRGAKIADIVVLVVAADDGVKPQTLESIRYIKESQTPFLVAITKIDLPTAQPEKVESQLLKEEILPEKYGGDVVLVKVSSKVGTGIDELLDMILLVAELNDISADPEGDLEAYVVEAEHDSRKGVVVHAVVKNGTLKIGDQFIANNATGKARGLFNETRKPVSQIFPGMPVEIIGFSSIPQAGSLIKRDEGKVKEYVKGHKALAAVEGFPVLVKADTAGSLEAILGQLSTGVGVVFSGLGDIFEFDVLNASATSAVIVGFNVKADKDVQKIAEEENVKIYTYKIIYELLHDIDRWIKEKEELGKEKIFGRALIVAQFPHDKKKIAGSRVLEGRIVKTDRLRLVRGADIMGNVRAVSIKKQKIEVDKVTQGDEFGILFEPQFDFQVGDVIESWSL